MNTTANFDCQSRNLVASEIGALQGSPIRPPSARLARVSITQPYLESHPDAKRKRVKAL